MTFDLVCLGNPLLDIQIRTDDKFLQKYNLKANDGILVEEFQMPIYEDVLKHPTVQFLAGGAAQNSARGAQAFLPPQSVVYFGSVGRDVYSEKLHAANDAAGLATRYLYQDDIPTGKCAVVVTGTDRSLVTDLGAANHYKVEHLKEPENWKLVEGAKAYYVGGYHLTVSPPAILALGEHAASANKPFAMNISAPFLPTAFKDAFDSVAPYWDYLIGNESEALAYAESHDLKTTDIAEIAKHLALLPKANEKRERLVVITQGVDDTIVAIGDVPAQKVTLKTFPVETLDQSKIADSNGAGDAFAGGFYAGVVAGKSLEDSVHQGQWLAREGLQLDGPQYPPLPLKYPGRN